MKVLEIRQLIRKDVPIYYRRLFSGTLVVELVEGKTSEGAIDFIVETKPTGINEVIVTCMPKIDYPLIPLKKEVNKFITILDETGGLPS
jgi:hypothetical protein